MRKIVVCPECKGEKKAPYNDGEYGERIDRVCKLCKGEGLAVRFVTIEYKDLSSLK